jgi:hypothetical protein
MIENYSPDIHILPIHNIVKSHLVIFQHSNATLCPQSIEELSLQITETIESFLNSRQKDRK